MLVLTKAIRLVKGLITFKLKYLLHFAPSFHFTPDTVFRHPQRICFRVFIFSKVVSNQPNPLNNLFTSSPVAALH